MIITRITELFRFTRIPIYTNLDDYGATCCHVRQSGSMMYAHANIKISYLWLGAVTPTKILLTEVRLIKYK